MLLVNTRKGDETLQVLSTFRTLGFLGANTDKWITKLSRDGTKQ